MKKILSLILAGLMTVSCAAFVAADDAAVEATDPTQAYAISFLAQNGIYHGKSNEEFVAAAADPIERYQMALFVARISTGWVDDYMWDYNYDWEDNTANNSTFTDLAGTAAESYLGAISYANQKGIIEGYSATKFGPTDGITYRDALTMVVRTMGYQGLIYPWGYIEKAVELGLTEGIEGVTYTDALNRGQVAVILYNAMFAPCKGGETLAKSIFDVDFAWETIVITASDEVGFANNGKRAAAGYVGFNIVDENGKIGAKTYYVKEAELGLDAGHAAELAVGSLYNALFTVDGDIASLVDYDSALIATVINNGITDNEGVAYEKLPVLAALADYTLVKENAGKEYITFMGNEMFVYEAGVYAYYVDTNVDMVAIDKDTCNIMFWNQDTLTWDIGWYYNETLNKYYEYEINPNNNTLQVNWMSDAEFADWYAKVSKILKTEEQYVLKTSFSGFGEDAYAKLSLYNADADAYAEIATYKNYRIGIFSNSSKNCTVGNVNGVNHPNTAMPTYKITDLEGKELINQFVEADHEKHDPNYYANIAAGNGFAWINVADDVIGFVNEDGSYNNGVVVYNYNNLTGELEVVKYIPENAEGTDADSYIFTGILQSYSTANTYITVNGDKYYYGYDKLNGNTMIKGDGSIAKREVVAEELDEYLMQYVKVTVVDGLVVDVDLLNDTADVIVVLGYAGVSNDGYICVYGYHTGDPVLKIFKINSYNGWKQGDYRYYPANAQEDDAFKTGAIYNIKSYDAETESYGVTTQNIDAVVANAPEFTHTYEQKYRIEEDGDVYAANDTYIIIDGITGMVYVKTGVKDLGAISGKMINRVNDNKFVVYVADTNQIPAAYTADVLDIGFILYDKDTGRVLEAAYDEAIGDWYLLGSTTSTLRATNLLTGDVDYVYTTSNVDLIDGCVYMTIGNMVVRQVSEPNFTHDDDFINAVTNCYTSGAKYQFGFINFTKSSDVKELIATGVCGLNKASVANATVWGKMVAAKLANGVKYFDMINGTVYHVDLTASALADNTEYTAFVVYDVANAKAVVYINAAANVVTTTVDKAIDDGSALEIEAWYYDAEDQDPVEAIEATLEADWEGSYIKENDEVVAANIEKVALYFDVDGLNEHDDVAQAGYVFGIYDDHDVSHFGFNDSFVRIVSGEFDKDFLAQDMQKWCYACDEEDCNMVAYIGVAGLDITLDEENTVAYVRFEIMGDKLGNNMAEGNNVVVVVRFDLIDGEVVASIEQALDINDGKDLQSIELSLIG